MFFYLDLSELGSFYLSGHSFFLEKCLSGWVKRFPLPVFHNIKQNEANRSKIIEIVNRNHTDCISRHIRQ